MDVTNTTVLLVGTAGTRLNWAFIAKSAACKGSNMAIPTEKQCHNRYRQ
jgi:hypothetical protein